MSSRYLLVSSQGFAQNNPATGAWDVSPSQFATVFPTWRVAQLVADQLEQKYQVVRVGDYGTPLLSVFQIVDREGRPASSEQVGAA